MTTINPVKKNNVLFLLKLFNFMRLPIHKNIYGMINWMMPIVVERLIIQKFKKDKDLNLRLFMFW